MKLVRILLRVSSNQQLEADGDLTVQRQLDTEYINRHPDWKLDAKEYFEGGVSGYKNSVDNRDVLQEALQDARNLEYDILVVYKDDRLGRRMWEIGAYVMTMKQYGVDIYTVKDGCISPDNDDIMGQMILALRYGNAQKSSSDTGMRVKDTAQKLVQRGRFLGGTAPYGYELVLSGEISKRGRALHMLKVVPEKSEIVKHIYKLALYQEFGSGKIAKTLNLDDDYRKMAPRDVWRSATITSILKNPIYIGRTAYKRRERKNGMYHRLGSEEWIIAREVNPDIAIIDEAMWEAVQEKRSLRGEKIGKRHSLEGVNVIRKNDGELPLIDVLYCGCCNRKLTNGTKYNYWTIKGTGEKRASRTAIYRCQNAREGIPHDKGYQFPAKEIETVIFENLTKYLDEMQDNNDAMKDILENSRRGQRLIEEEIRKRKEELRKLEEGIDIMESNIPNAMTGDYPLSLEELTAVIKKQKEKKEEQEKLIRRKADQFQRMVITDREWERGKNEFPTWKEVFEGADISTKRVIVNRMVEKISVTKDQICIKFRINMEEFQR